MSLRLDDDIVPGYAILDFGRDLGAQDLQISIKVRPSQGGRVSRARRQVVQDAASLQGGAARGERAWRLSHRTRGCKLRPGIRQHRDWGRIRRGHRRAGVARTHPCASGQAWERFHRDFPVEAARHGRGGGARVPVRGERMLAPWAKGRGNPARRTPQPDRSAWMERSGNPESRTKANSGNRLKGSTTQKPEALVACPCTGRHFCSLGGGPPLYIL